MSTDVTEPSTAAVSLCGTGRSVSCSTSGPPGRSISTAFICFGLYLRHDNGMAHSRDLIRPGPGYGHVPSPRCITRTRTTSSLVRTEALYPTQAAAVLGVVQLFKNAILKFPQPSEDPRCRRTGSRRRACPATAPRAARAARQRAERAGRLHHELHPLPQEAHRVAPARRRSR